MQRTRVIKPDMEVMTQYGPQAVVSRQALTEAFLDAASVIDVSGGVITFIAGRAPTGVPNEMVTTGLVMEWKDRTDAKPQAERVAEVVPQVPEVYAQEPDVEPVASEVVDGPLDDGLDPSTLEEEDTSSLEGAVA